MKPQKLPYKLMSNWNINTTVWHTINITYIDIVMNETTKFHLTYVYVSCERCIIIHITKIEWFLKWVKTFTLTKDNIWQQ